MECIRIKMSIEQSRHASGTYALFESAQVVFKQYDRPCKNTALETSIQDPAYIEGRSERRTLPASAITTLQEWLLMRKITYHSTIRVAVTILPAVGLLPPVFSLGLPPRTVPMENA